MKPKPTPIAVPQSKLEKSTVKHEAKQQEDNKVKKKVAETSITQQKPSLIELSKSIKLEESMVHKWSGKRASKKAFDRSRMLLTGKKLFTSPKIEDVTGKYGVEEELVTCGICDMMDPPVDTANTPSLDSTTEWVGCDCYRWFHQSCTKLTKITEKFSCKSVRMRCQESVKTEPAPAVLQVAILRFIRDRDISFIEDLIN